MHKGGIEQPCPGALFFSMDTAFSSLQNYCHGADTQSHEVPAVRFADASSCVSSRRQRVALAPMRAVRPA